MAGEHQPPDQPERRAEARTEIFSDLRGEVMIYQVMTVRQISHTGVLVDTTFPLHIDSLHDVRLSLATASIVLKGRVAHCAVAGMDGGFVSYRAGLEFVEPNAAARLAIAQFIDALKSAEWRSESPGVQDPI
jgi:hypothetical protein